MKTIKDMTTAELVAEYNALTSKSIKKFSSRAAGEKQVEKAREHYFANARKEAAEAIESVAQYRQDRDGCPACHATEDQTYAGLEGTVAGSRFFCHRCGTEYTEEGKIYNRAAASASRSAAIANSWKDPEVAAIRAKRLHVVVDGQEFKSVHAAFVALNLALSAHIRVRMQLRQAKSLTYAGHLFQVAE